MEETERRQIRAEFANVVNMSAGQLEKWLATDESRAVGWTHEGEEAVGHQSGRRIVELKRKKVADLADDDYAQMRKVIGYCHRHLAQRPDCDVSETRWRHSLMNWGHHPLED